jgi:hypothetical protein
MKWKQWIAVALVALALVSPVEAQRARTPVVCTRIVSAGAVHNGQYAGINCVEGHYLAAVRADGTMPATGPARVSRGAIVDAAGVRWAAL